ncbi:MAG: sulfotransferase [Planctomycetota bacterium]
MPEPADVPTPKPAGARALEALTAGNLQAAQQLAAQALQANKADPDALTVIGRIRLFQGQLATAEQVATAALQTAPTHHGARMLSAYILAQRGDTEASVRLTDALLSDHPGDREALEHKAATLERAGRRDEALAALGNLGQERTPAARITEARSQVSGGDPTAALATIDSTLADDEATPRRQYHLHMLRAKALDKLERYDEAFAAADAGNRLAMPQPFDTKGIAARVDAVIATFSEELFAKLPRATTAQRSHVFIAGFPRTGTTLVEQILDAHPDAAGVGEAKELEILASRLQQAMNAFVAYPACAQYLTQPQVDQLALGYEQGIEGQGMAAAQTLVNKNLNNLVHLGMAALLFPGSKVIFTDRDPRDTGISCFMGTFRPESMPHLFAIDTIADAMAEFKRLAQHWKRVLPLEHITVRYEDLVRDCDAQTRAIVEHAGLPWDDRCLRFFESGRTVMTLAYDQVNRPIYDSSVGRHTHYAAHVGPLAALVDNL